MRKSISKFIATAAAISMIATAGAAMVNAEEPATAAPVTTEAVVTNEAKTIANYVLSISGEEATILDYTDKEVTELTIPEELKDGDVTYKVTGVGNFAFANLDKLTKINFPASIKMANCGDFYKVTKHSLDATIKKELGADPKEADVVAYVAKAVKYNGKTEGWTEAELNEVKTKATNQIKAATGIEGDLTAEKLNADVALTVLKNTDKLSVKPETLTNINDWTKAVKVYDLEMTAPEGSEMAKAIEEDKKNGVFVKSGLPGDYNDDGEVTVRDCAAIARDLAVKDADKKALLEKHPNGDYNGDGELSIRDAAAIARMLATKK